MKYCNYLGGMTPVKLLALTSLVCLTACDGKKQAIVVPFNHVRGGMAAILDIADSKLFNGNTHFGYDLMVGIDTVTLGGKVIEYPSSFTMSPTTDGDTKIAGTVILETALPAPGDTSTSYAKGSFTIHLLSRTAKLNDNRGTESSMKHPIVAIDSLGTKRIFYSDYFRPTANHITVNLQFDIRYDSLDNIASISLVSPKADYLSSSKLVYDLGAMDGKTGKGTQLYLHAKKGH